MKTSDGRIIKIGIGKQCVCCREPIFVTPQVLKERGRVKNIRFCGIVCKRKAEQEQRLKSDMLLNLGNACACCGETEPAFLTLDHIGGWARAHMKSLGRKKGYDPHAARADARDLGWPRDRFRVLCMNCNFATSRGRTCPHQRLAAKIA